MEESAILVFSFVFLALATIIAMPGVDACTNIPSMDIISACHQASTSPRMYDLCTRTLSGVARDNGEVLTYALAAATAAARSFESTAAAVADNVSGEMKAACEECESRYGAARKLVGRVVGSLEGCFFDDVEAECVDAVAAVDDCATAVMLVNPGVATPLHGMVLDDRDRTVLVLRLISLFVRKNSTI
ncbi:hypothetical protein BS78_05G010900 [Paspalum vaginatum]|nr:hypothetical protein BS78_05G010900 [Paspalum vaginatum]